jgi:alpha-amylase
VPAFIKANSDSQGYDGAGNTVDYSVFDPFDSSSYFHSYCLISNYENQTNVEDCWLGDTTVSLPDLNTELTSVQTIWYDWVADLVANYSSELSTEPTKDAADNL